MADQRKHRRWIGTLIRILQATILLLALSIILGFFALTWMPSPEPLAIHQGGTQASNSNTEIGVGWVPGLGPRLYGTCTRVLSIDGGGMRGLIPALILSEIEKRTGKPIAEQFDLVAGTSTGAIIALGLTRPSNDDARKPAYRSEDLVTFYREHGPEIFPNEYDVFRNIRRIFVPKYTPETIETTFGKYFEDVRLIESLTNVLVPGYDIEDHKRIWFSSLSRSDYDIPMKDLVRGTTAAPTYLPPARFVVPRPISAKGYVALVDGGLFANNPSVEALKSASAIRPADAEHLDKSILLLSLGTGHSSTPYSYEKAWRWGVLGWIDPLLEIAFDDPAIEDEARRSLGHTDVYARFQVELGPHPRTIDDSSPSEITHLTDLTNQYIAHESELLDKITAELAMPRSPQCGMRIGADYDRSDGPRVRGQTGK